MKTIYKVGQIRGCPKCLGTDVVIEWVPVSPNPETFVGNIKDYMYGVRPKYDSYYDAPCRTWVVYPDLVHKLSTFSHPLEEHLDVECKTCGHNFVMWPADKEDSE